MTNICFSSVVVNYLERIFFQDDDVGIAFIYCNYKDQGQTAVDLLGSLLQQLFQRQLRVSDEFTTLYQRHIEKKTRPSLTEFSRLLQSQLSVFSKVFVVLDALDECPERNGTRDDLLSELQKLQPTLRLLVTARPNITPAEHGFNDASLLEIQASDKDIERYVQARIDKEVRLKRHVKADPTLTVTIINTIVKNVKGMLEALTEI
jgi:NACHT domain